MYNDMMKNEGDARSLVYLSEHSNAVNNSQNHNHFLGSGVDVPMVAKEISAYS